MIRLLLLLAIPAIFAFDAQFQYGCGADSCIYKFVIEEDIAQYVDPNVMRNELDMLGLAIERLNELQEGIPAANTTAFDEAFDPAYNETASVVLDVTGAVSANQTNFETALQNAISSSNDTDCLATKTICFQSAVDSSSCGSLCT
ncbi:hypothetical protein RB195_019864 [Necator americanus]|uniref:Uncharacterized protein n=1 Tax=Necator americanus TaxID=51031 RepID=A0ABR1CG45_NECAM